MDDDENPSPCNPADKITDTNEAHQGIPYQENGYPSCQHENYSHSHSDLPYDIDDEEKELHTKKHLPSEDCSQLLRLTKQG
jgi:hypothetical protein